MAVKKGTKKNTEVREATNVVSIIGQIKQVITFKDSIAIYKLDNVTKSPNNKAIHTYLTVKEFKPEIECEENDMVQITGHISTDTSEYNGKKYYNTFIVVDELEVLDN
jgi:hypothetical protein